MLIEQKNSLFERCDVFLAVFESKYGFEFFIVNHSEKYLLTKARLAIKND